jgi:hypothetical protein
VFIAITDVCTVLMFVLADVLLMFTDVCTDVCVLMFAAYARTDVCIIADQSLSLIIYYYSTRAARTDEVVLRWHHF